MENILHSLGWGHAIKNFHARGIDLKRFTDFYEGNMINYLTADTGLSHIQLRAVYDSIKETKQSQVTPSRSHQF